MDTLDIKIQILELMKKMENATAAEKAEALIRLAFINGIDLTAFNNYLREIRKDAINGNYTNLLSEIKVVENNYRLLLDLTRLSLCENVRRITESKNWWEYEPETEYPKGFFKEYSPTRMAKYAIRAHGGDYTAAIRSLIFYKNRAGKNFNAEIREKIDKAVEIIRKKKEKRERKEKKNKKKKK